MLKFLLALVVALLAVAYFLFASYVQIPDRFAKYQSFVDSHKTYDYVIIGA